jgi:hypothetical protein
LSVILVAVLLGAFYTAYVIAQEVIRENWARLDDRGFWVAHAALATFYGTSFALAYLAAAAMITFATENRSTPLRLAMLVQQAAWVGWMAYALIESGYQVEVVFAMALIAGGYWYTMGTMLTGEQREMSRRVMRSLPQSFLGRMFLTWLNPGPGSGYMFVVANLTTIALLSLFAIVPTSWFRPGGGGWPGATEFLYFLVIGWAYIVAYLGLGRLLVAQLRRVTLVTMFAGVLIHFLLVLAGSGIPTTIQLMSLEMRNLPYSYVQVTNPFWSLYYILESGVSTEADRLLIMVPAAAVCMLLLNLPGLVRELRQVRVALPVRVAEDEAELHPAPAPQPTNPWEKGIDDG